MAEGGRVDRCEGVASKFWCAAGPLAFAASRAGGRAADAGLLLYGAVEVAGAGLVSGDALAGAAAVQLLVAASYAYSELQSAFATLDEALGAPRLPGLDVAALRDPDDRTLADLSSFFVGSFWRDKAGGALSEQQASALMDFQLGEFKVRAGDVRIEKGAGRNRGIGIERIEKGCGAQLWRRLAATASPCASN